MPYPWILPAVQSTQPNSPDSAADDFPLGHRPQSSGPVVDPCSLYVPAMHVLHRSDPGIGAYFPARHHVQAVFVWAAVLMTDVFPASHCLQTIAPPIAVLSYSPAGHGAHLPDVDPLEYFPVTQETHPPPVVTASAPSGHAVHPL